MRILLLALIMIILSPAFALRADTDPEDQHVKFEDVTEQTGLKSKGRCAAWVDLDNDGWVDLIADGRIWRNHNGKYFTDVTDMSGIANHDLSPCVAADFNGDGRIDLYFVKGQGALYLNQGGFRFIPGKAAANPYPQYPMAAAAADLDGDGYPDLYVANYEDWEAHLYFPDIILRNNHGALELQWVASGGHTMPGRGVTCCDFNNDGKMDIYVSNYRLAPNFLWVNYGNWKFLNEAREYGCAGSERKDAIIKNEHGFAYGSSGHTIGSVWADFDNDTYFDLFVGNFSHPPEWQDRPQFLQNSGPADKYRFVDKSAAAAIPWQESYASPAAADVDNDGRIDLFFTTVYKGDSSRLFRNLGNWKFRDVTEVAGTRSALTYQAAFADFDNDGRIDLITGGRLYRNISRGGDWLKVKLSGKAPDTMAIGARVIVDTGDKKIIRQVEAGTGSGNQNEPTLHFGLGKAGDAPLKLTIIWPDGARQEASSRPNRQIEINAAAPSGK
ncbi:MAG: CRTAC1 family protein [Victivallaceae bacterium]